MGAATSHWQACAEFFPSTGEMVALSASVQSISNQEIAEQLCLALNTEKRHAYNLYAKLDVKTRTQAA